MRIGKSERYYRETKTLEQGGQEEEEEEETEKEEETVKEVEEKEAVNRNRQVREIQRELGKKVRERRMGKERRK